MSNLIILDNYTRMLLFLFGLPVYWKISQKCSAFVNTWLTTWLQSGHVNVVKFSRLRQHLVNYLITKRARQCRQKQNIYAAKTIFKTLIA